MFTTVIAPNVTGNRPTIPGRKYQETNSLSLHGVWVSLSASVIRSTSFDIAHNGLGIRWATQSPSHPGSAPMLASYTPQTIPGVL